MVTNLVLLATVAQTGFPKVINYSRPTHDIIIFIGKIIVFTFKRLTGSIFALTSNPSDELGR